MACWYGRIVGQKKLSAGLRDRLKRDMSLSQADLTGNHLDRPITPETPFRARPGTVVDQPKWFSDLYQYSVDRHRELTL
jgi:hypothetical protein